MFMVIFTLDIPPLCGFSENFVGGHLDKQRYYVQSDSTEKGELHPLEPVTVNYYVLKTGFPSRNMTTTLLQQTDGSGGEERR